MKLKNILVIILIVALILIAGFFLFNKNKVPSQVSSDSSNVNSIAKDSIENLSLEVSDQDYAELNSINQDIRSLEDSGLPNENFLADLE